MSSDVRDIIVNDILMKMSEYVEPDILNICRGQIYLVLENYTIIRSEKGLIPYEEKVKNDDIVKRFIVAKKIEGLAFGSLKIYLDTLRRFFEIVETPWSAISTADIQIFFVKYMQQNPRCGLRRLDHMRKILCSFFKWLSANKLKVDCPTDAIKVIRFPHKEQKEFTPVEVEKMRVACGENLQLRALIECLLSTGCRISEILQLNRNDINFVSGEMVVLGKGNKERTVYLTDIANLWLQKYLNSRKDSEEALFVSKNRPFVRLGKGGAEWQIRNLGLKVGVKSHPHKFRRTAATWALKRGMRLELVQKMLGHSKMDTTLMYAKVADDSVKYEHKKYLG